MSHRLVISQPYFFSYKKIKYLEYSRNLSSDTRTNMEYTGGGCHLIIPTGITQHKRSKIVTFLF